MLLRLLFSISLCTLCACSLTTSNGFEASSTALVEDDVQIVRLDKQPTRTPVAETIALPDAARVSSSLGGISGTVSLNPTIEARIVENLTDLDCEPPDDWGIYIVQGGDTLYSIAFTFNSTIQDLKTANCLVDARRIEIGQTLAIPDPDEMARPIDTSERVIDVPQTVDIYMVSNSGDIAGAIPMGCDQYMVPVQTSIFGADTPEGRISTAINMLFTDEAGSSNTINRLAAAALQIDSVVVQSGAAQVSLSGSVPTGDTCSTPQIRAQIEQTILADHDVNTAMITINGQPF